MYKRLLLLSSMLMLAIISEARDAGIVFFQGSWKELLAQAEASHKLVFVDVFTDWCTPCKQMEKQIFVLPEVAEFYNRNFICYRLNAEKGEGPGLANIYGISAYPTWLYLNSNGTLRSRGTDYMIAADFIETGKNAISKDSTSAHFSTIETRFRNGERDTTFLRMFLELRTVMQLNNSEVLDAYIGARKKGRLRAEELRFLVRNSGRSWSAAAPLISAQLDAIEMVERKKIAADFFEHTLYFAWGDAAKAGDRRTAEQADSAVQRLYPLLNDAQQLTADHARLYYCRKLVLPAGLKEVGYRIAAKQMAIDTVLAQRKDKELLDQVMKPFLDGTQDSTKIPAFAEEKKLAARQYSGKVASLLYEVADAFSELLPAGDPGRQDAALWAERAHLLAPNDHTRSLITRLAGSAN